MRLPRFFEHHDGSEHSQDEPLVAEDGVHEHSAHEHSVHEHHVVEIDPEQLRSLSNVFAAPKWLRDAGLASWLLAGVAILLVGVVWLLALTAPIVDPVMVGLIVAVVASPSVAWLTRHRVGRTGGAAIVVVVIVAIAAGVLLLVVGGITSQGDAIRSQANDAAPKVQHWLTSVGIDSRGASGVTESVKNAAPGSISTLVHGIVNGITGLASIAIGVSFAFLAIFFLLKDGPSMREWVDAHLGVAPPVARLVTGSVLVSLRRYFLGVTFVAAFNGIVVGLGALALGVPLAGTIAVVSFVTAYIPYLGAFVAGAFAVILALGAKGTTTAVIMLVIVLLANGLLQNIFQPIAFGATLRLNPLVVLIVTIGAGCLFGMIGLVLAAPLLSAARQIAAQLGSAREAARRERAPAAEPAPET
jgi:putative heme transporter